MSVLSRSIVLLSIAYNGSIFHGYQRQPGLRTVESVLFDYFKKKGCWDDFSALTYSYGGRTDAGVSAVGQIVSFSPPNKCITSSILDNNNDLDGVFIWGIRDSLPPEFKARYWVLYRDYLYIDKIDNYVSTDIKCIRQVLEMVLGIRDFSFLYKDYKTSRYPKRYFHRRILKTLLIEEGDYLFIMLRGESFPSYFVRRLVDFLRKYDCRRSFEENIVSWRPGMAEARSLFLLRTKTPYYQKIVKDPYIIGKRLLQDVFRRGSSGLLKSFFFFVRLSWFS